MNEQLREAMSALVDGEASELEIRRILKAADDSPQLREAWANFHAAGQAMRGEPATRPSLMFADQLWQALENEPAHRASRWKRLMSASFFKPAASFAVAASVAGVVFVSGQTMQMASSASGVPQVAVRDAAPPPVLSSPARLVSTGAQQYSPAVPYTRANASPVPVSSPVENNDPRMQAYLLMHAAHAAQAPGNSLLPYARLTTYHVAE